MLLVLEHTLGKAAIRLSAVQAVSTERNGTNWTVKVVLSCGESLSFHGDEAFAAGFLESFRQAGQVK